MKRLLALFAGLWATSAAAEGLPSAQADLFAEFARAVSGGDAQVMARAAALIEVPPTTLEEIGFYGLEAAPAGERALRGIISVLDNAGYFFGSEDKYVYELPALMVRDGLIGPVDPGSDVALLDRLNAALFAQNEALTADQIALLRDGFWPFADALEQAVADQGRVMLQLHMPLGDTTFYWAPPAEVAARWQDGVLYEGPNTLRYGPNPPETVAFRVAAPDWEQFWGFLTYAYLLPEDQWALPPR